MCIPWILYWIAGYREENPSECGCEDKRLQPGAAQTHGERWDTMDLWAGAGLEESCQRTGGLCHMEWFRWGEETKEFSQKSSAGIVFKSSFLFSLVLGNFMVNQTKLLPPNVIASCCVFVGILCFLISMALSTLTQGCLATPFPVLDGLVRVVLSVS